jgi:hypothetical protein
MTYIVSGNKYSIIQTKPDRKSGMITAKMTTVEPDEDEFVENSMSARLALEQDIVDTCKSQGQVEVLPLTRTVPDGVDKLEHCNNIIEEATLLAEAAIYKNTLRCMPTYVLISADLLPLFACTRDFIKTNVTEIAGTYNAGMCKGIKVLVSPVLERGQMIYGVCETNASGIYTFVNDEGKVCNKILNPDYFVMIKLED